MINIQRYLRTHEHPLVRAAHQIICDAFDGEYRKGNQAVAETFHMEQLCAILVGVGLDDPIDLAVALLHDVMEDIPHLSRPKDLRNELRTRLSTLLVDELTNAYIAEHDDYPGKKARTAITEESGQIAKTYEAAIDAIVAGVSELTNDDAMPEGKRSWQVDHAREVDDATHRRKMADQIQNMRETVSAVSKKWDKDYKIQYLFKALDVCRANMDHTPLLGHLAEVTFEAAMRRVLVGNYEIPELGPLIAAAEARLEMHDPIIPFDAATTAYVLARSKPHKMDFGMTAIGFAEDGKVTEYAAMVNPTGPKNNKDKTPNFEARAFRDGLEASILHTQNPSLREPAFALATSGLAEQKKHAERWMQLVPAQDWELFQSIARQQQMVDQTFIDEAAAFRKEHGLAA